MIAGQATHDELLIAGLTALGLVLVALIGIWGSTRATNHKVQSNGRFLRDQMPTNGERLTDVLEDIRRSQSSTQGLLNHLVQSVDDHHANQEIHVKPKGGTDGVGVPQEPGG